MRPFAKAAIAANTILLGGGGGGPPVVIGTPVAIALGLSASPGAQSITVPSDAEGVVVLWSYFSSLSNAGMSNLTSNFAGTFTRAELQGSGSQTATGAAYADVTSTGAKTITPVWTGTPTEGPIFPVAFVKGIAAGAWVRGTAFDQDLDTNAVAATVGSNSTDMVLRLDQKYGGSPATQSGWTSLLTQDNQSGEYGRMLSAVDPTVGAATTTGTVQSPFYSTIALISLISA